MKIKQLCILGLLLLSNSLIKADTITLPEAIKLKYIILSTTRNEITSNPDSYTPTYTGKCLKVNLQNISGKNLRIHLEPGRFMMPDDSTMQRMMVTREEFITLNKSVSVTREIYAMCSQMHNRAPSPTTTFNVGEKATGNLLAVAELISKNNYQSMAGQNAVWAISDNNDPSDIYSENKAEVQALKDFVFKATGKKEKIPGQYIKYEKGKVKGSVVFELKKDKVLSIILYNEAGVEVKSTIKNYTYKVGINTVSYEYQYFNIPAGNYYLKFIEPDGTVFLNKMLTFKYD